MGKNNAVFGYNRCMHNFAGKSIYRIHYRNKEYSVHVYTPFSIMEA